MDNHFDTDWDPYDHIVKLTHTVNEIAAAHNRLAHQCLELEQQLRRCQQQITDMNTHWSSTTAPVETPLRD